MKCPLETKMVSFGHLQSFEISQPAHLSEFAFEEATYDLFMIRVSSVSLNGSKNLWYAFKEAFRIECRLDVDGQQEIILGQVIDE